MPFSNAVRIISYSLREVYEVNDQTKIYEYLHTLTGSPTTVPPRVSPDEK